MEIRCVKGMCGLKVAGSEENLGFKGLKVVQINTPHTEGANRFYTGIFNM